MNDKTINDMDIKKKSKHSNPTSMLNGAMNGSTASMSIINSEPGNDKLRILWVKMGGLWPITSGGRLRSFHIINELSQLHDVTVLTTHSPGESAFELKTQLPLCRRVDSRPFAPAKSKSRFFGFTVLRSWLSRWPVDLYKYQLPELRREVGFLLASGNYDLCIADFMAAVPNVPFVDATPVVLFSHNVEYMIWRRLGQHESSWLKRLLLAIEWRKMRRVEAHACNDALATIAVSEEDAEKLQVTSPHALITSVPTGVDVEYFKPDFRIARNATALVFSGSMDWVPNEDAMLYFIQEVLPKVRERIPQTTLSIVGRNPSPRLRKVAMNAQVEVTGTVSDIRPWLHKAAVYIVPLRIGGGTRLKIYEALSMAMPVVSTTVGAEGLNLQEDIHIMRADTAGAFATSIITLMENAELRDSLGREGRTLMEENYAWSRIAEKFAALCREAMASRTTTGHSTAFTPSSH
ncbi:MAG: glycosyltransferase family 4 protein [Gammaproteobacteria bacterium]|nr:glycosyltransferase family 4 protein [Gammaproteobacteria bacterium]MDP2346992.1 glycosyltransferase family 4 protein [Gammaproteobacteria bacterium]